MQNARNPGPSGLAQSARKAGPLIRRSMVSRWSIMRAVLRPFRRFEKTAAPYSSPHKTNVAQASSYPRWPLAVCAPHGQPHRWRFTPQDDRHALTHFATKTRCVARAPNAGKTLTGRIVQEDRHTAKGVTQPAAPFAAIDCDDPVYRRDGDDSVAGGGEIRRTENIERARRV